jgi:hypothetical protein
MDSVARGASRQHDLTFIEIISWQVTPACEEMQGILFPS